MTKQLDNHFPDDDFEPSDDGDDVIYATPGEATEVPWTCASCGELNETDFELEGGLRQTYVEDCRVCCRPNLIDIRVDPGSLAIALSNELEYDS